ncbi:class I SAM-dependent methyltransferase [Oryzibacter oryziterrae]|uniref:class I SAM-dependent methyltransferase n=1 Tax=Oryzibacter oryziterrae TaxID=2766474 RepID=UPI001F32B218|nr:class I SAM-dependent methyltransferase [Oryzibacter oryziterrae]
MNALASKLAALIRSVGPLSIADYMAAALGDPEHGYYTTRNAIGLDGDFITAPEISQMFGELIAIWCLTAYEAMGSPETVHLVELGPGRGTLMADLLRAARTHPAFRAAVSVHLVEMSPTLREAQRDRLTGLATPRWHDRLDQVPEGPLLVVANEFFDALPIRQFVKTEHGWRERVVGLNDDGDLAFGVGAGTIDPAHLPSGADEVPVGAVAEINRPAEAIMAGLARRLRESNGAAIVFDYGHTRSGFGETFQAVRAHRFADPLDNPGECDITAHVDFEVLARTARSEGARVHGPVTQGDFLLAMGLLERAGGLGHGKSPEVQEEIVTAVNRLAGPEEMGVLFKVLAVSAPTLKLPGFESL